MTPRPLGAVAILGLPGAGKTTLARSLAESCGASIVSRDDIREAMFRPCGFTEAEKASAFAAVLDAVRTNCALGRLSIVEGMPFSRYGEYEAVDAAVASHGRSAVPILLSIDPDLAGQRITAQRSIGEDMPDDRDAALPHTVHRRFRVPPPATLELDGSLDTVAVLSAALERIHTAAPSLRRDSHPL